MNELFFAEATDYSGFRTAIRQRVEQLNISRACLDSITGSPDGYTGRLLAPLAHKKIGQLSLGRILRAAGLKMLLVDDPDRKTQPAAIDLDRLLKAAGLKLILIDDHEALAQVAPMYEDRASRAVRLNNDCRKSKGRKTRKISAPRLKKPAKPRREKPYLAAGACEGRP
jgi:hypothetical protein